MTISGTSRCWSSPVRPILEDLLRVLDCNADNFIAHPFDPPYLLSLIEGMLTVPVERQTPDQIKTQFKIKHDDQVFVVTADRRKLLEFLLSSFEIAVNKSSDLSRALEDNQQPWHHDTKPGRHMSMKTPRSSASSTRT